MKRLFSLLMAAFLCCSLQNLSAESAEQAAEGVPGAQKKMSSAEIEKAINQLGVDLGKSLQSRGTLGACNAGTVAKDVGRQAAKCVGYKALGSACFVCSADDCAGVLETFTRDCCSADMGSCLSSLQLVLSDIPSQIKAIANQIPVVGSKIAGYADQFPAAVEQYGCSTTACGEWPIPRICAYFAKNASEMGTCWDKATAKATDKAIAFMKAESPSLAAMDPFVDLRKQVLRGIFWPTDGSKADCWTSDNCGKNPSACNADYAAKCRGE